LYYFLPKSCTNTIRPLRKEVKHEEMNFLCNTSSKFAVLGYLKLDMWGFFLSLIVYNRTSNFSAIGVCHYCWSPGCKCTSMSLSSVMSFTCHKSYPKDPWFSHLNAALFYEGVQFSSVYSLKSSFIWHKRYKIYIKKFWWNKSSWIEADKVQNNDKSVTKNCSGEKTTECNDA
jgi:hypothetical protein